uniref:Sulfotransfer_1 domain-containing protein n=1 Tax=Rhabditophanes sp. KR3021 TaxID=114890 RepID=A0AC35TVC2_9BILA
MKICFTQLTLKLFLIFEIISFGVHCENYKFPTITKPNGAINSKCSLQDDKFPCIRITIHSSIARYHYVSQKYKLHACTINKAFSSMMVSILCLLYDKKRFFKIHRHLNEDDWNNLACSNENLITSIPESAKLFANEENEKKYKHIMVVRNPIARLISSYTHLCIKSKNVSGREKTCFNSNGNIQIFLERLYESLTNEMKFGGGEVNVHRRNHFHPSVWNCDYVKYKKYYTIIKYSSKHPKQFYRNLMSVLRKQNIPKHELAYIRREISGPRNAHATYKDGVRWEQTKIIWKSPYLLDLISRIYFEDFMQFGYKLPNLEAFKKMQL